MLNHVSYSFPSEWLVLGEALVAAVVVLALSRQSPTMPSFAERFWRVVDRLPHGRTASLAYFVLGALGAASVCVVLGAPAPRVSDEHSYLLVADTLAQGRLSNPTPPRPAHFEQQHVLSEPTRMGKYPPAPSLVLALGQVIGGQPAIGLWIQSGLLAVSVYWLVAALMAPPWPGLAALLVVVRLGIGSYWHQSYWGGGLAAIGGCLVLGGLVRFWNRPRAWDGIFLGLGVALLANTRYYEGFVFALPCGLALAAGGWLRGRAQLRQSLRSVTPIVLILVATGVLMVTYNVAVTHDPWLLPHLAYTDAELDDFGHFLWTHPETRAAWPFQALRQLGLRFSYVLQFTLGLPLALVLLLFVCRRGADRRILWVVGSLAMLFIGMALTRSWWQHYAAPGTGALVLLTMIALQRLRRWRWQRWQGSTLAAAALLLSALSALVQVRAYRADADDWSYRRQSIQEQLEAIEGRHLVLVRYLRRTASQWVFNPSDLEGVQVLWARELSNLQGIALASNHPGRRVWILEVEDGWWTTGPVAREEAAARAEESSVSQPRERAGYKLRGSLRETE